MIETTEPTNEFELIITIQVSLDEAETIESVLSADDEWHLAEHVAYCIKEAKQKAGLLQKNRN